MRVCHVAPLARHYLGGPLVSVPSLCAALGREGIETSLLCLDLPAEVSQGINFRNFARWEVALLREFSISPGLRNATRSAATWADVMHSHGMWQMPSIYPCAAAARTRCRLVVSPRGSLAFEALRHSRLRKRMVWWLAQRRVFEEADCIHATSSTEAADIRLAGLKKPVAVIPNGVHIKEGPVRRRCNDETRTIVYLGRLHPIKGLETLLRAWALVQQCLTGVELLIVGDGTTSYRHQLNELHASLGLQRVSYRSEVKDTAKQQLLDEATVLVLPSRSENFGMVVAEALAAGVPALVSRGAPWEGVRERRCGWWIESNVSAWAHALEEAMRVPPQDLEEMGARGRAWMKADFSWQRVGEMMAITYRWLLGQSDRPGWVHED